MRMSIELLTDKLALEEAEFNQKIAAADKGLKVGLRLSGHSIQEDRPSSEILIRGTKLLVQFMQKKAPLSLGCT